MSYNTSTYAGDEDYSINCTGDVVVGDEICFERAVFSGSFRRARFAGFERITGRVTRESYGADKQQHTFTIEQSNGANLMIKGRNLYANGTYRKPWINEAARFEVANEKHSRGDFARAARNERIEERQF